jgi:hypothetical protein
MAERADLWKKDRLRHLSCAELVRQELRPTTRNLAKLVEEAGSSNAVAESESRATKTQFKSEGELSQVTA